jgi:hypothetical protein
MKTRLAVLEEKAIFATGIMMPTIGIVVSKL